MYRLSIEKINELIENGSCHDAFLELMRNHIKWNAWDKAFVVTYLKHQLGFENIKKLYQSVTKPCVVGGGRRENSKLEKRTKSKYRLYLLSSLEDAINSIKQRDSE